MSEKTMRAIDGNEATADVAYRLSEISAIYPITPSSNMGEWADEWASQGRKNIWGAVGQVVELQSEGGASGTLHGLVQTGALATTYTASQGLLLMIPNMYKIAGELSSTVLHVSARSIACQALSIFGDHSDVMATRQTGFAMLCSSCVQSAHDLAAIAHAATFETRLPFLHFFEGFRTSHEVSKIEILSDDQLRELMDDEAILAHRKRALSSDHPVIRGTSQNPDVYFQGRETVNPFYEKLPAVVEKIMEKFSKMTGRKYNLVNYYGEANAERIIVVMGSGTEVIRETIECLRGEKIGVVQIHLYRPFPKEAFIKAIPASVKAVAVLDRTKEPGSAGEPLYQDVITTLSEGHLEGTLAVKQLSKIIGGRYGLSSKEFTPAMAKAIFDELAKDKPKNHFTIGIHDDVSHTSLEWDAACLQESDEVVRAMFYGLGADGTVGANKNSIKIIGDYTNLYAQGYFVYDSKKSGARTISHLRFGPKPIRAPYLLQSANFVAVHQFNFIEKVDVLEKIVEGGTFLLNSTYGPEDVWQHLPCPMQEAILNKKLKFYIIDAYKVARETGMGVRINTIMQTCFFKLADVMPVDKAIEKIKEAIKKTYGRKGEDIVNKNFAAVDQALSHLIEVNVPDKVDPNACQMPQTVSDKAPEFVQKVVATIMKDQGDTLPVSAIPNDGTFPMATTKWEKRNVSLHVADWDPNLCIQCGRCTMICPHAVLRAKHYEADKLKCAPEGFKHAAPRGKGNEGKEYTLQSYIEDCTGCGLCHEACPAKNKEKPEQHAINLTRQESILDKERKNIDFFEMIPYTDREKVDASNVLGAQYLEPLFEFSGACTGCGETPYVKLVSQLFGDRMVVANATGCSSIYGGNLPTTPWAVDKNGRGPAWSNSLFEDNAEFGFGFCLTEDKLKAQACEWLQELSKDVGENLVKEIVQNVRTNTEEGIAAQRKRVAELKVKLEKVNHSLAKHLLAITDHLVKHSIWIMGGDGWAYDIGYGGLDHVLSEGHDLNVLVLDTEVYSNTGGQASKATPRGAIAKFAVAGKRMAKKDLAKMAIAYDNVYVAQIALGANMPQALKAIHEAESYEGTSIIIAYSHCIAHGFNLRCGMTQQKLAVESGCWPLFRFDPRRFAQGQNPLILDSKKPSIPVKDYVYNEARYKALTKTHPAIAEKLLKELQEDINHDWQWYEDMAARAGRKE